MTTAAITIEGLWKGYAIGGRNHRHETFREMVVGAFRAPFRRLSRSDESGQQPFWALQDINFTVRPGEVVGVIGRNGAGKSTLLKVLSRITEPTRGEVRIRGRVASLLEIGTGFHGELTGRENIFLNGAILGMGRAEIARKFDEIAAFAEIDKFLDTPVKRYSSGMYVRLAFAVAAYLEPDILIVDEVLAVGDAEFQKKCLGKMRTVAREEGRTVLMVSHNMAAVQSLCATAVYLRQGAVAGIGPVDSQVRAYLSDLKGAELEKRFPLQLSPQVSLEDISFVPAELSSGEGVDFSLSLRSSETSRATELALFVYSEQGARVAIVDMRSHSLDLTLGPSQPLHIRGKIRSVPLVEGRYSVGAYIVCGDCRSNFFDLASLVVGPKKGASGMGAYPAEYRGLVELDYQCTRG